MDNTLVEHGAPVTERAIALFERLRKTGYDTCIISNNKEPRVRPLAEAVHSKYVSDAKKPSPKNYIKAMECMKTDVNTTFLSVTSCLQMSGGKPRRHDDNSRQAD